MERREAEFLYESGKEAVVEKLLELTAHVATLERRSLSPTLLIVKSFRWLPPHTLCATIEKLCTNDSTT